jgi:hypothetical protein
MLTALLSLPNELVYIQFHPVAYMVKLKIEMSMASLITRLARGQGADAEQPGSSPYSHSHENTTGRVLSNHNHGSNQRNTANNDAHGQKEEVALKSLNGTSRTLVQQQSIEEEQDLGMEVEERQEMRRAPPSPGAIHRRIDIDVTVHSSLTSKFTSARGGEKRGNGGHREDELPLAYDLGHPMPELRHEKSFSKYKGRHAL